MSQRACMFREQLDAARCARLWFSKARLELRTYTQDLSTQKSYKNRDTLAWVSEAVKELKSAGVLDSKCVDTHGAPFITKWAGQKHQICKAQPQSTPGLSPASEMWAFLNDAHNIKMMIVENFQVVLDSEAFTKNVDDLNNPKPQPGSLKTSCLLDKESKPWLGFFDSLGPREVRQALSDNQGPAVLQACGPDAVPDRVVDHPVLLLHRYDVGNAYHHLEDVVTMFLTLAVMNSPAVKEKGIQVLISDSKGIGFFPEIWQRLSHPHPVRVLRDEPFPPGTCFRHMVHPPYAGASLFSYTGVGRESHCRSPILLGLAHWLRSLFPEVTAVRRSFNVQLQTQRGSSRIVTRPVLWISRRNFEGLSSRTWNSWQRTRMYSNENELLLALHTAILQWNDGACFRKERAAGGRRAAGRRAALAGTWSSSSSSGGMIGQQEQQEEQQQQEQQQQALHRSLQGSGASCRDKTTVFELQTIELSDVPFYPEQLHKLTRMSILVAAHGAGLANQIWMSPGQGGVLEIAHNAGGNYHYANMAHWLGHRYTLVDSGGSSINVAGAVQALTDMMEALA